MDITSKVPKMINNNNNKKTKLCGAIMQYKIPSKIKTKKVTRDDMCIRNFSKSMELQ